MAGDVEELSCRGNLAQVQLGGEDALFAEEWPREVTPVGGHDRASAAAEHLRRPCQRILQLEIGRVHRAGQVLAGAHDEDASLERDVPQRGLPAVAGVGGGSEVDALAGLIEGMPRDRIGGDERFGQDDDPRPAVGGCLDEGVQLREGRVAIEHHRRCLDSGNRYPPVGIAHAGVTSSRDGRPRSCGPGRR